MAAIHLLRSQISLLYSSKFKLIRPSINSLIIHNQHHQNPNFSRHFRPIHSITPKSSPEKPTSESSPGGWRTFSNPQSKPTDSIKSVSSNGEEGLKNQHHLNPNFSRHFRPIHSITPKSSPEKPASEPRRGGLRSFSNAQSKPTNSIKSVGSNGEEGSKNQHNQHHQNPNFSRQSLLKVLKRKKSLGHSTTQWQGTCVGSNGEEGSKNWVRKGMQGTCKSRNKFGTLNKFSVSENETSENMMKLSGLPEQMVGYNAPVHPITPKSFPESPPLIDINGASEEPTSEPSPRPQSAPTNSIKSVGSSGEEGSRIRVNSSSVSENETSENRMKSSSLPEQMVGHNAPVHPITPISFPEPPLINANGASEEPTSEPSPRGWSTFSSPPSNPTNSIKGVGSSGEEGSRIRVNLSSVSENETSENRMKSSSLPEQMVGHNAPVHPITPISFPEPPLIDANGASEEPTSEPSPRGWSTFSSPPSNPTNSIKGVGSSGEEGSRIRVNLSSVSENETSENMMKSSSLPEQMVGHNAPVRLMDVNPGINHMEWRIRLSGLLGLEVNRVLGGGVVPGSLILVGGDPGVGKSTLALQMAALIAVSCDVGGASPVLYISGEESVQQIRNRADQLSIDTEDLFLYSSTVIEDILEKVQLLSPRALVIDSIQSVYLSEVAGSPGGLMQVKECTSALLRFAKKTNIPVLLIGHVNKNGEIAGPRVLEDIVDVVLYMEGEKHPSHRLLRSVKNRFGSTDELGVFEMSESGLEAVSNPSEMFFSEEHSDSENLVGLAVAVMIDGSLPFLVKVQALCVSGPGVSRLANGVQLSRVGLILSVLKNQLGLKLDNHSIFLNVISGVSLTETSGDLAVAAAICSSFLEFPLPNRVAFIGEIGLGGELLMVPRIEKRVITLAKLGYKKCVVPESAGKALGAISSEIQIVGCKNLKEVLDKVFRNLD